MTQSVVSTTLEDTTDGHSKRVPVRRVRLPRYPRNVSTLRVMADGDSLSELMGRYANGEDAVFESLYRQLAPRLYGFCRRLAMHQSEADDCFQETFLKIHRARATYVCGANALYWAFAVARSVYLSRVRYWRRRPEDLGDTSDIAERTDLHSPDDATPEAEIIAADLLDVAAAELSNMSEKNRSAYILLRDEGLTAKDAAAVLGTTADVVRQRAHRAHEQVRAALTLRGALEEQRT